MKAHIIACGPSAKHATLPDDGAMRIAVNFAGGIVPVYDWLCVGDAIVPHEMRVRDIPWPKVGVLCPVQFVAAMRDLLPDRLYLPWDWMHMDRPRDYSANVALWGAFTMGARDIHLWGVDHDSPATAYADGRPCPPDADRWREEVAYFEAIVGKIVNRGARIVRHRALTMGVDPATPAP